MEELLTTLEAADVLGISRPRLQQFVYNGRLKPVVKGAAGKGPAKFARVDVETLKAERGSPKVILSRTDGAVAKRVFALFELGRTLPQVVAELEISPIKVRALYREWATPLTREVPPSLEDKARKDAAEREQFQRDFDREQAERRAKVDREHAERMRELDKLRPSMRTKRKGIRP